MSSKEQRRFPKRYATQIPVEFMDKTKAKGTLINLSRDGILIVTKKLKPLNSFVRLMVSIPGLSKGVEINGKIVRHTTVKEQNAMGIRFLEMNAADRDAWMKHISSLTQSSFSLALMEQAIDERSMNIEPFDGKESQFILKFKSLQRMEDFFPQDWKSEDFFIRTNIKKAPGDKLIIRLIHPQTEEELKLNVLVRKYGRHPLKVHKEGIFFNIIGYNSKIEAKIRKFLGIEAYED